MKTFTPDERLPVWNALSDFFLDTELDGRDYERIATTLVASRYSLEELEAILRFEVYPVCIWNLRCVAGEWAGFNQEWLQEHILPYKDQRPFFRCFQADGWLYMDDWKAVSALIVNKRARYSS